MTIFEEAANATPTEQGRRMAAALAQLAQLRSEVATIGSASVGSAMSGANGHCRVETCRGQALAVALAGRRKAVPLPRTIEKIRSAKVEGEAIMLDWQDYIHSDSQSCLANQSSKERAWR